MICDLQLFLYDMANEHYEEMKEQLHEAHLVIPIDVQKGMNSLKRQSVTLERADDIIELVGADLSYLVREKLEWHRRYMCLPNAQWLEQFYGCAYSGTSLLQRKKHQLISLQTFCEKTNITYEFLLYSELADFQWRFVYGKDRA